MQPLHIASLPKAELHMHFESSLRPATASYWATRYGLPLPQEGPFQGLSDFVVAYEGARDLVRSLGDVRRAASELVRDAAAQGVVWSEVHLIPPTYAGRLGPEEGIVEAVLSGFADGSSQAAAEGARPSAAGLIIGINRGLGLEAAERSLALAMRYAGEGVVGLGLAGDEARFSASPFADVFRRGREAGLSALPHGGEGAGAESVRTCVEDLGATRICHGVRAVEDPTVVALLRERGVSLDVCPHSNVSLRVSPSLEQHQLIGLLEAKVKVTLNSDGPLFSGATVNEEYEAAHMKMGIRPDGLARIARTSIEVSACPSPLRQEALRGVEEWLEKQSAFADSDCVTAD
ncbi:adenosine deaminase [Pedococcus cremeus]|uniref:Adenosine deaminase n=1 Tax=Pedococcus cremeus TaxID=587636 RepID=A0A1H9WDT6_9MICO|nr:adenosine deaminase [Pedococcus cremeus]